MSRRGKGEYLERKKRGLHLLGTLKNCDLGFLGWRAGIFKLLQKMPGKIGMNLIPARENPLVLDVTHEIPTESGITGISVLWESHVSLHGWTHYGELDFDVFSCNWFEPFKVVKILKAFFKAESLTATLIDRSDCSVIWRIDGKL